MRFADEPILGFLVHNDHTVYIRREHISKSETVVEGTEDDVHFSSRLVLQVCGQLAVMVADKTLLAPDGLPCLIERGGVRAEKGKAPAEIFVLQHQSESRPVEHRVALAGELVLGGAVVAYTERYFQCVGR